MTPRKCKRHELAFGELADSERYSRAVLESLFCWRCRLWAFWAELWGAL